METIEQQEQDQQIVLPAIPPLPLGSDLSTIAERAYSTAVSIKIDSPEMYEIAVSELQSLQGKLDQLNDKRFSITRPMDAAKKAVMDLFRSPQERCEAAIALLKRSMLDYSNEQRRIADEQRREAEKAAKAERDRQDAIARQQREAAEKAEKEAAEARRKVELAAAVGDTTAAAAAQAQVNQAESVAHQAQQTAAVAEHVASVITAPLVESEVPTVKGITTTTRYKAEVVDMMALIKFVAANPQYAECLEANQTALNKLASSLKTNLQINGVRVVPVEGITSRRVR